MMTDFQITEDCDNYLEYENYKHKANITYKYFNYIGGNTDVHNYAISHKLITKEVIFKIIELFSFGDSGMHKCSLASMLSQLHYQTSKMED